MRVMKFSKWKKTVLKSFLGLFAGMLVLMACPVSQSQEAGEPSVAVMPFVKGKNPDKIEETLNCPYANICFEDQNILPGAEKTLTRMLQDMLRIRLDNKLVPADRMEYIYETMKINYAEDTPASFAQRIGKSLKVKYVVAGNVWRYKNRTGESFASSQPSSVAFSVYLIDVENHELIWTATYDETQQSLTENLLNAVDFFKQGAKWLTADELARYGLKKILKTFPDILSSSHNTNSRQ
jgi:TolB-like protein